MRKLDVHVRPEPLDNLALYDYCKAFLYDDLIDEKIAPIEFNCIDNEFSYNTLVPNKTIVELFNKKRELYSKCFEKMYRTQSEEDIYQSYICSIDQSDFNPEYISELASKQHHDDLEFDFCACMHYIANKEKWLDKHPKKNEIVANGLNSFISNFAEYKQDCWELWKDGHNDIVQFETLMFYEPENYELVYEYDDDASSLKKAFTRSNNSLKETVVDKNTGKRRFETFDINKHTYETHIDENAREWRTEHVLGTLKKGHNFEVRICDTVKRFYGKDLGLIYGEDGQTKGETEAGIEFKHDVMSKKTGNFYIEFSESRHGGNLKDSGAAKEDNTKYILIGTMEDFFIVKKDILLETYKKYADYEKKEIYEKVFDDKGNASKGERITKDLLQKDHKTHWIYDNNFKNAKGVPYKRSIGLNIRGEMKEEKTFDASYAMVLRRETLAQIASGRNMKGLIKVLKEEGIITPDDEKNIPLSPLEKNGLTDPNREIYQKKHEKDLAYRYQYPTMTK